MFKSYTLSCRDISKQWILIDAKDIILGRLAVIIADRLRGKHKVNFTRHMDDGDNIIVINARHVKLTGKKASDQDAKIYYRHTGYPGGLKEVSARDLLVGKHPERVIKKAVERMMPYCKLSDNQLKNLYVYPEAEHRHEAQQPQILDVASLNEKNKR